MNFRFKLVSAAVLSAASGAVFACATCGCSLSSDAAQGYSSEPGFRVSVQYDYINQDQLRSGRSAADRAQVAANNPNQEIENKTRNRYITVGLSYTPDPSWNFKILVPYIDRYHDTYGAGPSLPLTPDQISSSQVSSLGDIKVIGSYQGLLPTHNLGIQFGVKLPTGAYGGPNADGSGAVGRSPVAFNSGPNAQNASPGNLLDTSLQAGTGSTDMIVGAFYYQPISQDFDFFVNGQYQASVHEALNQSGADYRPGDQATLSLGVRYEENPRIVPQLQLNLTHRNHDTGALADTADSAGTVAYLSPGLTASLAPNLQVYGFVQVPVYSKLQGYQLFPHWTASAGISVGF